MGGVGRGGGNPFPALPRPSSIMQGCLRVMREPLDMPPEEPADPSPGDRDAGFDDRLARWVEAEILPHEAFVRRWLARRWGNAVNIDDTIQEAYCRIAQLRSVAHIANGRSYFFKTVQSVVLNGLRREKADNIRFLTEIDWLEVVDDRPSPDRMVESSQELERVQRLLGGLSSICSRVIELRRIHGLSQRETAAALGVSEHVVENNLVRGLRKILAALTDQDARASLGEERGDD